MKYTIVFPRVRASGTPYAYVLLGCVPIYTPSGQVQYGRHLAALTASCECVQDTFSRETRVIIGEVPEHFNYASDPAAVPDGIEVRFGFDTDGSLPKAEIGIDDHENAIVTHGTTVGKLVARVALILRVLREEGTHA